MTSTRHNRSITCSQRALSLSPLSLWTDSTGLGKAGNNTITSSHHITIIIIIVCVVTAVNDTEHSAVSSSIHRTLHVRATKILHHYTVRKIYNSTVGKQADQQTDRQTDRQTDGRIDSVTCSMQQESVSGPTVQIMCTYTYHYRVGQLV